MASDDDSSDDWGQEELVIPDDIEIANGNSKDDQSNNIGDWKAAPLKCTLKPTAESSTAEPGERMWLVDLTELSDGAIHCRFDPNGVNDMEAVRSWRKKLETTNSCTPENAIPCGSSVWRSAIVQLRKERPGHYFCPIFPKK